MSRDGKGQRRPAALEEAVDAGMKLALNVRYYKATTAVLVWLLVIASLSGALSWWWTFFILLAAAMAGHINRWDERVKQRAVIARERASGTDAAQSRSQVEGSVT